IARNSTAERNLSPHLVGAKQPTGAAPRPTAQTPAYAAGQLHHRQQDKSQRIQASRAPSFLSKLCTRRRITMVFRKLRDSYRLIDETRVCRCIANIVAV